MNDYKGNAFHKTMMQAFVVKSYDTTAIEDHISQKRFCVPLNNSMDACSFSTKSLLFLKRSLENQLIYISLRFSNHFSWFYTFLKL